MTQLYGFRAGMKGYLNEDYYKTRNREILKRQRELKKMVRVIRAKKCMNTEGRVCTKEY